MEAALKRVPEGGRYVAVTFSPCLRLLLFDLTLVLALSPWEKA